MSFSYDIKIELCRLENLSQIDAFAELMGLIDAIGVFTETLDSHSLFFKTENNPVCRRIYSLIKFIYDYEASIRTRDLSGMKRRRIYTLVVDEDTLVKDLDYYSNGHASAIAMEGALSTSNKKRSYLRGAFLGSGSINNPEKLYHLEISTNKESSTRKILEVMDYFNLEPKRIDRGSSFIIYLKDGDKISDFLNIISAHKALLKFEDIRTLKDVRNSVNRMVNCETANLDKTVNAAFEQIRAITKIKNAVGFKSLPENLREIAELRLEYSEDSLRELGSKLNPPLGKSGVNHRLKKIMSIAEKL